MVKSVDFSREEGRYVWGKVTVKKNLTKLSSNTTFGFTFNASVLTEKSLLLDYCQNYLTGSYTIIKNYKLLIKHVAYVYWL